MVPAGVVRQEFLGGEEGCFVVLALADGRLELHLLEHPEVFTAGHFALQADLPQRLVSLGVFRINAQPLKVHLDGVFIVPGVCDGPAAVEKDVGLTLVFFGNALVAFWDVVSH
jgi:hypothetical protein